MEDKHSDKTNQISPSIKKQKKRKDKTEPISSEEKEIKRKKHNKKSSHSTCDNSSDDRRKKKKKKSKHRKKDKSKEKASEGTPSAADCFDVPVSLMTASKKMAPMTKGEWEKKQSVVRKVFDETSGRYRLIKGDGEVIEEIVSKEKHKEINQQATKGDGTYFQSHVTTELKN